MNKKIDQKKISGLKHGERDKKEKETIEKNIKTCYQGVTNKLLESPKVIERKILGEKKFWVCMDQNIFKTWQKTSSHMVKKFFQTQAGYVLVTTSNLNGLKI